MDMFLVVGRNAIPLITTGIGLVVVCSVYLLWVAWDAAHGRFLGK